MGCNIFLRTETSKAKEAHLIGLILASFCNLLHWCHERKDEHHFLPSFWFPVWLQIVKCFLCSYLPFFSWRSPRYSISCWTLDWAFCAASQPLGQSLTPHEASSDHQFYTTISSHSLARGFHANFHSPSFACTTVPACMSTEGLVSNQPLRVPDFKAARETPARMQMPV